MCRLYVVTLFFLVSNKSQRKNSYNLILLTLDINFYSPVCGITWYLIFSCLCCFFQNFLTFLFFVLHDQHPFFSRSFVLCSPFFAINEMDMVLGCYTRSTVTHRNTNKKKSFFSHSEKDEKKCIDDIPFKTNRRRESWMQANTNVHNTAFEKEKLDWLMWQSERFARNDYDDDGKFNWMCSQSLIVRAYKNLFVGFKAIEKKTFTKMSCCWWTNHN